MFTVKRMFDCPGPTLGDGVEIGKAETVDELHELLRDVFGTFEVSASAAVRLELAATVGDDRAFVEQIAHAAQGRGPVDLVSQ